MSAIPFDAFAFTHTLVDAGVPTQQADSIAQAFNKAIQESNAAVIEQVKRDYRLDDVTTNKDLDARIKETELKIELAKSDLQRDIEKSRADITALIVRLGFLQVGLIVALLLKVLNMI